MRLVDVNRLLDMVHASRSRSDGEPWEKYYRRIEKGKAPNNERQTKLQSMSSQRWELIELVDGFLVQMLNLTEASSLLFSKTRIGTCYYLFGVRTDPVRVENCTTDQYLSYKNPLSEKCIRLDEEDFLEALSYLPSQIIERLKGCWNEDGEEVLIDESDCW